MGGGLHKNVRSTPKNRKKNLLFHGKYGVKLSLQFAFLQLHKPRKTLLWDWLKMLVFYRLCGF